GGGAPGEERAGRDDGSRHPLPGLGRAAGLGKNGPPRGCPAPPRLTCCVAALSAPPRRAGAAGRGVSCRATRRRPRPLPRPRRPPAPRGCAGATAAARRSRLLPRRSPRSASRSSSPWGEPDRARFHGAFLAPRPAWTDLLGGWPLAVAGGHGRDPNPDDAVAVDLRHLEAVA